MFVQCHFEGIDLATHGHSVGPHQIECASPSATSEGGRRVGLTINGQQFAWEEGQAFGFHVVQPLARLNSLRPAAGPPHAPVNARRCRLEARHQALAGMNHRL